MRRNGELGTAFEFSQKGKNIAPEILGSFHRLVKRVRLVVLYSYHHIERSRLGKVLLYLLLNMGNRLGAALNLEIELLAINQKGTVKSEAVFLVRGMHPFHRDASLSEGNVEITAILLVLVALL